MKPLIDRSVAVGLFNPGAAPAEIRTDAPSIGLSGAGCYAVHDLWTHATTISQGDVAQTVPAHGVAMLRVKPGRP